MKRNSGYIRDGRAPIPKNAVTSKIMSAIRAKNTKPEMILRKALVKNGLIGYRLHPKNVPGRPDVCFTKKKIAIFVHGCYWHRCPHCEPSMPKTHIKFWKDKFERNKQRDIIKAEQLKKMGWKVCILWECDVKKDRIVCSKGIQRLLGKGI